jgi:oligopeptidase B
MAPTPPRAARKPLTHDLHGESRPDDYHWLKTQGRADAEVLAYLKAENTYLDAVMSPLRTTQQAIYQELLSHVQEEDDQPPVREGDWLYFTRTEAGQAHLIFLRRPAGGGEAEVLLDLNALKEREGHQNVWVYLTRPSPDGRYFAYLLDTTGQEVWELRVLDTRTGDLAGPPLRAVGGWTLAWNADSTQLFYSTDDATQRPHRIWRHTLGREQREDELLWQEDDPTYCVSAALSENGETLLIETYASMAQEWLALDARDPQARPRRLLPRERGLEVPQLTDGGDHWLALTNQGGASEFRLVRLPRRDGLTWADARDVLPHDPQRHLTGLHLFASHLLVSGREGGFPRLWVLPRTPGGYAEARRVEFPEASYTVWTGPNRVFDTATARILYTSLTRPTEHLDLDLNTLQTTLVKATPVPNHSTWPSRSGPRLPTASACRSVWCGAGTRRCPRRRCWGATAVTAHRGTRPSTPAPCPCSTGAARTSGVAANWAAAGTTRAAWAIR